jgi:hypothetical protein
MKILEILNDELFEMVNLGPNQTGISGGYIYISTRKGPHGCRLNFFQI